MCLHGDIDLAAAEHIALERGAGGIDRRLAADHAHATALGHAARHTDLDHVAGRGVGGCDRGQEPVELIVVAELQQVALAHGLVEFDRGDGGATATVVGLEAAHVAVGETTAADRAHELAAVVGALVAHHLVARRAVLVGVREVAVEAPLELTLAGCIVLRTQRAAGQGVVELLAVDVDDGVDVVGRLHAALELERGGAGVDERLDHLRGVGVARAERTLASGGGDACALLVHELIGQTAGLGAHAAVRGAARHGEA